MQYDLTIIIPTFNEEENISDMVLVINKICSDNYIKVEIIVVDDNSPDGTIPLVKSLMDTNKNLRYIVRTENPGLSQSLYEGMANAKSDILQCIDCDFSHPPDKIPALYNIIKQEGYDMAIGSRYVEGGGVSNWSMVRRILSFGAAVVGRLLIPNVKDSGSGFFAINKNVLHSVTLSPRGFRMGFEILGKARWNKVKEIPIIFKDREFGQSKIKVGVIYDYLVQCVSIFHYNFIERKCNNIIRAWKIFLDL